MTFCQKEQHFNQETKKALWRIIFSSLPRKSFFMLFFKRAARPLRAFAILLLVEEIQLANRCKKRSRGQIIERSGSPV